MKYIVKNCPCNIQNIPEDNANCCSKQYRYCYSISDCLIKRVIEKCKNMKAEFDDEIKNGNYIAKFKWFKSGRSDAGKEILDMFDIEEVKE